jgi:hypothetical protein
VIGQKQLENVEYFSCLGSVITNGAICTREIKPRIAWQKQHSTIRLFTNKLDLNLRKKLMKCCIWNIALYGAETWILRKVDQKYLESFEMWCWRRMEKISWTYYIESRRRGEEYHTYSKKKEG